MARKLKRPGQVVAQGHLRLDLLVVFLDVGVQFRVALQRRCIDAHGQRLDVSERRQFDGLRLLGNAHMLKHRGSKPRTRHLALLVAQPVGTLPRRAPLGERLAQISYALSDGIPLFMVFHQVQTLDGQLAGLGQVAIDGNQRVHRSDIMKGLFARQTGRTAVSCLRIVVVQPLPGIQLAPNDTQQVVIIIGLAVLAHDDEGFIAVGLYLGQHFGVFHSLLAIALRLVGSILAQSPAIVLIHLCQYGAVDGLQRHVRRLFSFSPFSYSP